MHILFSLRKFMMPILNNSVSLDFIEDLQAVIQTDSSLLLTWSLYTSAHTIGFYIYINGHQVGMVGINIVTLNAFM